MLTLTLVTALLLVCFLVSRADARPHHVMNPVRRGYPYRSFQVVKHSPRFLVARALNRGLAGSPMASTGFALEAAGWKWKVSPFFVAGIAATESSLGVAACPGTLNYWGLASCGNGWNVPRFKTLAEAYMFVAHFLKSRWPNARTTYDYHGYAACSSCWGASTASHMLRLFGVGNYTRYGATGRVL